MTVTIQRATLADIDTIAPLFDAYRQFYACSADLAAARDFIAARLQADESVIFVAMHDHQAVGFTQLYPSFSSTRMARLWILNDLFVDAGARGMGVASQLIEAAEQHARDTGACGLTLSTAVDNLTAQSVYERMQWLRDDEFLVYNRDV